MRMKDKLLLGMDLRIGSEHGFKCCSANSPVESCVVLKRERTSEGGRRVILMARRTSLSVLNNHDPGLMGCFFKKMRLCMNCG